MPPKSDAQKQVDRERILEALKGFAKGSLNVPMELINTTDDPVVKGLSNFQNILLTLGIGWADKRKGDGTWDTEYVHENPRKVMRNIQLATRLPGAIYGAYKGYKESSPFKKEEDKKKSPTSTFEERVQENIENYDTIDYNQLPTNDFLDEFLSKLEEHGYPEVHLGQIGKARELAPLGAAGMYGVYPSGKRNLYFTNPNPSEGLVAHEVAHYLDEIATGEPQGFLSELIEKSDKKIGADFGKRMFPEEEGYKGYLGDYSRNVKEFVARMSEGEEGFSPSLWDTEERLINQIRHSVEDITDTPEGLLGTPQTEGQHQDITEIIKDIESYHNIAQQGWDLWANLPFEAQLKDFALKGIKSKQAKLSEADKQSLEYIETGLPFSKEKGYLWK